jgi:hypothetical protein
METYQLWEGTGYKGRIVRRLILADAISSEDPDADARQFFEVKTQNLHKVAEVQLAIMAGDIPVLGLGECWLQEHE